MKRLSNYFFFRVNSDITSSDGRALTPHSDSPPLSVGAEALIRHGTLRVIFTCVSRPYIACKINQMSW